MNWLDYILLVILALSAWGGLAQGFSRSALGVVVLGLGVGVAFKYYRLVGEYLDLTFDLGARIEGVISGFNNHYGTVTVNDGYGPAAALEIPKSMEDFTRLLDQYLTGQLDGLGTQAVTGTLAPSLLSAIAFLGLFLLTVWVVGLLLSRIPHLPILGPIDRAGGFCFGLARGFFRGLIVLVLTKILSFSGAFTGSGTLVEGLNGSQFAAAYFGFLHYIWTLLMPLSW